MLGFADGVRAANHPFTSFRDAEARPESGTAAIMGVVPKTEIPLPPICRQQHFASTLVMVRYAFIPMLSLIALVTTGAVRSPHDAHEVRVEEVRGALVMHGEYPHFVRRNREVEKVYEIDLKDAGWDDDYLPAPAPDTITSTPIFCIVAQGFEDQERLGETGRTTFVFTRIESRQRVQSEGECGLDGATPWLSAIHPTRSPMMVPPAPESRRPFIA